MKRLSFIFFLYACFASLSHAQGTYTAASCNYSDVNAVINGPTHTAVNGDTINIPSGTCTWTSNLVAPANVGFTLIGAGTPNSGATSVGAATPQTFIIDNAGSGGNSYMMQFFPAYSAPTMRVSMLAIDPITASTSLADPILVLGACATSGCPNVRIDNITFGLNTQWSESGNSSNAEAGILAENVFGVLDHNTIASAAHPSPGPAGFELFNAEMGSYLGVGSYGDNSWAQPDSFGTANNLFAENNLDYNAGYLALNDCEQDDAFTNRGGCRVVERYNTMYAGSANDGGFGIFQDHGTESGGRARGARESEVYNNAYYCQGTSAGCSSIEGGKRSGAALFFNNQAVFSGGSFGGNWFNLSVLRNVASWGAPFLYCGGAGAYDQNDGTVYFSGTMSTGGSGVLTMTDGSQSFTNLVPSGAPYSVYDVTQGFYAEVASNTATTITILGPLTGSGSAPWTGFNNGDTYQVLRSQYCIDQPGRGQGNYISGTTPTPTGWVSEVLDPIYRWGDTTSGGSVVNGITHTDTSRMLANRDYYDQASGVQTSSTSPFSCNGSTGGTGWGTLANRPSSCSGACVTSTPGCGYWASDANGGNGELYVWNSGAWTADYTPYTYPHPLDTGSSSTTTHQVAGTVVKTGTQVNY